MDKLETNFPTQEFKLLVCFRYVFFICAHGKEKLEEFLKDFNYYHPNIELLMSSVKKTFPFWTLRWACLEVNWPQTCTLRLLTNISTCPIHLLIQTIPNVPLLLVKLRRVSRICYNKIDFERHLYNMKSWFQARSYPKHLAQNEMSKVRFNKENSNTKQTK